MLQSEMLIENHDVIKEPHADITLMMKPFGMFDVIQQIALNE